MVLITLAELLVETRDKPHIQDQVFLAMELGLFREKVINAITDISHANKAEALETLREMEPDPNIVRRCTQCEVFDNIIKDACTAYVSQGAEAAIEKLEHSRGDHLVKNFEKPGLCPELFISITNETRLLFELVYKIAEETEVHSNNYQEKWRNIHPEECSEVLFSLSNPHRLTLMMLLKEEEKSFSDLSSKTGLRTGHLQFHLRTLLEKGLIEKEERGIYRLNSCGHVALDYLANFQSFICRMDEREESG